MLYPVPSAPIPLSPQRRDWSALKTNLLRPQGTDVAQVMVIARRAVRHVASALLRGDVAPEELDRYLEGWFDDWMGDRHLPKLKDYVGAAMAFSEWALVEARLEAALYDEVMDLLLASGLANVDKDDPKAIQNYRNMLKKKKSRFLLLYKGHRTRNILLAAASGMLAILSIAIYWNHQNGLARIVPEQPGSYVVPPNAACKVGGPCSAGAGFCEYGSPVQLGEETVSPVLWCDFARPTSSTPGSWQTVCQKGIEAYGRKFATWCDPAVATICTESGALTLRCDPETNLLTYRSPSDKRLFGALMRLEALIPPPTEWDPVWRVALGEQFTMLTSVPEISAVSGELYSPKPGELRLGTEDDGCRGAVAGREFVLRCGKSGSLVIRGWLQHHGAVMLANAWRRLSEHLPYLTPLGGVAICYDTTRTDCKAPWWIDMNDPNESIRTICKPGTACGSLSSWSARDKYDVSLLVSRNDLEDHE